MDISRLIVVIWLFLPIVVYLLSRLWRNYLDKKFPIITLARTVTTTQTVTYTYSVMNRDYTSQGSLLWGNTRPGDPIPIRYNPKRPEKSVIWLPTPTSVWIISALLWFASVLGIYFVITAIGLLFITPAVLMARWSNSVQRGIAIFSALSFFIAGLMIIAFAMITLIVDSGFINQNILWVLWNH